MSKLAKLQADFIAGLSATKAEIKQHCKAFMAQPDDAAAAAQLRYEIEALVTSGATFGLPLLAEEARASALWIDACSGGAGAGRKETLRHLQASLDELYVVMDKPEPPLPIVAATPRDKAYRKRPILVVDDSADYLNQIGAQLRHYGLSVSLVLSAEFNPGLLTLLAPALLLADAELAQQFGAELREFSDSPEAGSCLYLFMSAANQFDDRLHAARAGGAAFFTKPVNFSRLIDVINANSQDAGAEPYRVLVADSLVPLAEFTKAALEDSGFIVEAVNDPGRLLSALDEFLPDTIVMDVAMPGLSSIELAGLIRQQPASALTPIIFLSTEQEVDAHLLSLSRGDDDFLTRPVAPRLLVKSVLSRCQRARKLRDVEIRDGLTGLFQYAEFYERLERSIARSVRDRGAFSVCIIDLDGFKSINDEHGHRSGDQVLKSLSFMLKNQLRDEDICGRYSGERFAVILQDCGASRAAMMIDEIRSAFAKLLFQFDEQLHNVTFSAGITAYRRSAGAEALLQEADAALQQAKAAGRNRVAVHGHRNPVAD